MDFLKRANFIVLKDFDHKIILPLDNVAIKYKKGENLNLRVHGKVANEFIKKGLVELVAE